jgi:hypothetical protein
MGYMQIKKWGMSVLLILLLVVMGVLIVRGGSNKSDSKNNKETLNLTLYADFSNGVADGKIEKKEIALKNKLTSRTEIALALADELSKWTGLDFKLNKVSFPDDERMVVDWSKDSTLVAGLDDREFREGFHFYDAVSLNWFMMDSLVMTFKKNMDIVDIYYQSNGQPIMFPNSKDMAAQGLTELPVDQVYEGSVFFSSHTGGRGDIIADESKTEEKMIVEGVIFGGSLLKSDPGNNMTPYEAAKGLYDLVLKEKLVKGTDYSKEKPVYITCVDVTDVNGRECYLLSVSGTFNTKAWEYAVDYDYSRQDVYLMSEVGNQPLGSLRSISTQ